MASQFDWEVQSRGFTLEPEKGFITSSIPLSFSAQFKKRRRKTSVTKLNIPKWCRIEQNRTELFLFLLYGKVENELCAFFLSFAIFIFFYLTCLFVTKGPAIEGGKKRIKAACWEGTDENQSVELCFKKRPYSFPSNRSPPFSLSLVTTLPFT